MFRTNSLLLFMAACCLLQSGCANKNQHGLEDVKGTILLNGMPVILKVVFEPYDETGGLSSSSVFSDKDGSFQMNMQNGLREGKYRVRFSMRKAYWKNSLKPVSDGEEPHRDKVVLASALPEEFSTQKSQVTFEVIKGKKNVFNYDIVTDYSPTPEDIKSGRTKQKGRP